MSDRLPLQELESYLWGAATILRGLVEAGDYKQYVFPLLFFKRLSDVWDEEYAAALDETGDGDYARATANDRFVIPEGAHWNDVRTVARDVGQAIRDAMRAIEAANPDRLDGIFGDAPWTNKSRLPDATLKNLLEHFSKHTLSLTQVPEDELGVAYEFLIKKFADDSGHTAQEFYTNRTVVHLMVQMLDPQPGEGVYDPTCGTAGMLISTIDEVKRNGGEYRTLRLYGQERNHMTASIARMNLVLHGVENFAIARGDTLERPAFTERDRLRTFPVVLANPPYSIKQWNREAWESDAWGRQLYGVPPQSIADYAFFEHILASLDPQNGRCAILFPHGVLFRLIEQPMRKRIVEADLVDAVIGLGRNLFYNSAMPACIVVCRSNKPLERKGKVVFIDASDRVQQEKSQSFLDKNHIEDIAAAYTRFKDVPGFVKVVRVEEILEHDGLLRISAYVSPNLAASQDSETELALQEVWSEFETQGVQFWRSMESVCNLLDEVTGIHDGL